MNNLSHLKVYLFLSENIFLRMLKFENLGTSFSYGYLLVT